MNQCINYRRAFERGEVDSTQRPRPAAGAWRDTGGWCSELEAAELQRLAAGKLVLEIGTWKGRSALAMAVTADRVIAMDHFYGDEYAGYGNPGARTWEHILTTEARERIVLVMGDWRDLICFVDLTQFGLIYYDANHTYEATQEFLNAIGHTTATIAVHDYDNNPNHAGVRKAVDESGLPVRVVDRLAILDEIR